MLLFSLLECTVGLTKECLVVENKKPMATIEYDGQLFATHLIEIQSPANATLIKSYVNIGDKVTQSQLLFEFSSPDLQTELQDARMSVLESQDALSKLQAWSKSYEMMQASASLEKAKNELERTKLRYAQTEKLYNKGIVSKEECQLDQRIYQDSEIYFQNAKRQLSQIQDKASKTAIELATLKFNQAQKKQAILQQKISDLKVYSPVTGTLLAPIKSQESKQVLPFYPQKNFQSSEVVALIADLEKLSVLVKIDEFDIVRLQKDQIANIRFAAFPNYTLQGRVVDISNQNMTAREKQATTYDVKVALTTIPKELQDKLLIGMSAKVMLREALPEGLWVAKVAIHYANDEPYVQKLNEQTLTKQKVVLGDVANDEVLVLSGIKAGDRIALS